jgi:hypothetical protein
MTTRPTVAELEAGANFIPRHIGPNEVETKEMLRTLGEKSLDDFIAKVVPEKIRSKRPLELKTAMAERHALVAHTAPGTPVQLLVRDKQMPAAVVELPFVPHHFKR